MHARACVHVCTVAWLSPRAASRLRLLASAEERRKPAAAEAICWRRVRLRRHHGRVQGASTPHALILCG
eukprot:365228-Chlamydomonas_euryale.AAC.41